MPAILVNSRGGALAVFLDYFHSLIETGQSLIVAGSVCASACTLFAIMPREQVCVQPTVALQFHAAWVYRGFVQVRSERGTSLLLNAYPPPLRAWVEAKGGLTEPAVVRVMRYPETAGHFRICGSPP